MIIKNSPTFDTEILKVGKAIEVSFKNQYPYTGNKFNALIIHSDPLKIEVMYWDQEKQERRNFIIHIDRVVKELTFIKLLAPVDNLTTEGGNAK